RRDGALTGGEIARLTFDRVAPLYTQQVVSLTEYDKARSSLAAAQANVADIEAQLQVARHQLVDTVLRAPFAGVVTRVDVDAQEMVKAGDVVLHLHDISLLELDVAVAEREILVHRLATNETAVAVFSSIPDRMFPVQLVEWSTASDAQTRTYRVTFVLHAPDDVTILPGMSAEVAWPGSHGTGATLAI
ncbi:MAG: efflux RND transporter periplasmic adaptor subunit, partial [bacterium]|nr:efflux RND transporter periplasmic adaptor subunit [bacterium]